MIEELIVARLAPVTTNLHLGIAPREFTMPVATYNRIGTDYGRDLDGDTQIDDINIQISVFDPSPRKARQLAGQIRSRMVAWAEGTVLNVRCVTDIGPTPDTSAQRLYQVVLAFIITTVPAADGATTDWSDDTNAGFMFGDFA